MQKRKGRFIFYLIAFSFFSVAYITCSVSCDITVPGSGIYLGYSNGTYVSLSSGTYSNISRINNVWYVDDAVYPAVGGPSNYSYLLYAQVNSGGILDPDRFMTKNFSDSSEFGEYTRITLPARIVPRMSTLDLIFSTMWSGIAIFGLVPLAVVGVVVLFSVQSGGNVDGGLLIMAVATMLIYYMAVIVGILILDSLQGSLPVIEVIRSLLR